MPPKDGLRSRRKGSLSSEGADREVRDCDPTAGRRAEDEFALAEALIASSPDWARKDKRSPPQMLIIGGEH
jgi:hypothetical protein